MGNDRVISPTPHAAAGRWLRRGGVVLTGFLLVLLPLAGGSQASDSEAVAAITAVSGTAEVTTAKRVRSATVDMPLYPGDQVRTGSDGKAEIQYNDGHIIRLAENTKVTLNERAKGPGLLVSIGKIWARFKKMVGPTKFEIETPTVVAGIRGTTVLTEVAEDGTAEVSVEEGEVELRVKHLARVIQLRRLQRCRLGRSQRQAQVMAFKPDGKPQWYHWTDQVVTQKCTDLQQRLRQCSEEIRQHHQAAQKLHDGLHQGVQAMFAAGVALRAIDGQITQLSARATGGASRPGQRRAKAGLTPDQLRKEADAIAQALDKLEGGLNEIEKRLPAEGEQIAQLRRRVGHLVQVEMTGRQALDKLRRRREFDPHWQRLRPGYEQAAQVAQTARADSDEAVRLLDPADAGKPKEMFGCQRRWHFVTEQIGRLREGINAERDRLERVRAGQPPGPSPKVGPAPRLGRRQPGQAQGRPTRAPFRNVRHRFRGPERVR